MGYIGEDITDGRWQKIEYDSIPDYCYYCKHQGHKESDCIIKRRDAENKQRKEMENNKNRQENAHKNNEDMQNTKDLETGRRELEHNKQRQQTNEHQTQRIQEEWHTQKRKNNTQQVRFHADRVRAQQPQDQTGISIPTQNTYIDLEVQEYTAYGGGTEESNVQTQEHMPQNIVQSNRPSQNPVYNAGINEHIDQRNTQKRSEIQVPLNQQTSYLQEPITSSGIDSMLPLPTPFNIITQPAVVNVVNNPVGVAFGGMDGCGQENDRINQSRLSKGKGKIGEQ
ncbi:hypothetical protein EJD97_023852, partial [Solanum chilense]